MLYNKDEIIKEIIHRNRLRNKVHNSFKEFLIYMVPEFYTENKFEDYLDPLVERMEALIKKQELIALSRKYLSVLNEEQSNLAKMVDFWIFTSDISILTPSISSWVNEINKNSPTIK